MAQSKAISGGGETVALARRSRRLGLPRGDLLLAILALTPSLIAVAVFIYGFILWTGYISLVNWNDVVPDLTFRGLYNFQRLFNTERFRIDLRNTAVFGVIFIVVTLVVGFLLAVLIDQKIKAESLFRTIYLFPFAVSAVVTGVAWRWLMTPSSGLNKLFDYVGLGFLKNGWFTNPKIGIIAVTLAASWQMAGYVMALYLAGLRSIPVELREAAALDGANGFALYRHVIIPLLMPVTLTAFVILGTIVLRLFDIIATMTSSGAAYSTDTPAFFMFQTTFLSNKFSQGSAIAVVMLFLALLLVVPYMYFSRRAEAHQ